MDNNTSFLTWDMVHESATVSGFAAYNPTIQAYQHLVQEGLPPTAHIEDGKTVCIVGAGMAGLMAAELLADAGYEVTILEGAQRVGGRIHTVFFPDGDFSEAGAMRLLEDYQLALNLIDRLGLKRYPFINHAKNAQEWIFVNGIKVRRQAYLDNPDCVGFKTVGDERGKTAFKLWHEALQPIVDMVDQDKGLDTPENWQKVIEKYGQYSVYTYLTNETTLSPGAIEMIQVMLYLEARSHLSLLQQVVEAVDHRPNAKYWRIDGGTKMLPETLAKAIQAPNDADNTKGKPHRKPATIQLGAFVKKLEQHTDANGVQTVTVHWDNNALDLKAPRVQYGNDQIYTAREKKMASQTFDYAIVTCTPPAIRRFDFTPPLPNDKRQALREINFSASTKIFLQFSKRFWEDENIPNGSSVTDLANRAVYYPTPDDSKVVIASYTWADAARGWDSITPQQRVDQALDNMAQLHGEHIRDLFVSGQSYSWLLDNFSMGEAAMIFPEQLALQAALARPEGNIFFAGDTLSFKVAWVEGAIESGMRAALELVGLPPTAPTP